MHEGYAVGVGESPMSIAGSLVGDRRRYEELLAANPHKSLVRVRGHLTFEVLLVGERLNVPHGWRRRPHGYLDGQSTSLPDGYLGAGGDTLGTNQSLKIGDSITSPNGNVTLTMKPDGDLAITSNADGKVLWHSGTAGKPAHDAWMGYDGNLRVTDAAGVVLWDNGAHGHKDARARIENTGNLYVWDGDHHMIWDAGASVARPNPVPGGHGAAHTDFGGIDHDLKRLSHDLEHFSKDVIDDVKKFGPMILSEVQGIISLIPGIGTGISAAIGLAMALLEGGSPIVIAIRTAYGAIPIPPGIRDITNPIVDGCINFAEHPKDFTDVVIKTVRDQVPAGLPREVFDTLIKILIKHQPILKVVAGVVTDIAKEAPGIQSVIAAMPQAGTVFQSISQIAPKGVHIDVASIPGLVQAANAAARVQHQVDPATLATIAQQAQQRYAPLHALAVVTSMAQLAHKVGGTDAAITVLAHPAAAAATIVAHASTPPSPPILPTAAAPPYPPHPAPPPFIHSRVVRYPAAAPRAYPPYMPRGRYLPYAHRGYPPHAAHGVHGVVGECAPDCARWGEPVEMDHGMAQVANMLLTARKTNTAVSTGPDGVTYKFERSDAGITARPCLS